MFTILGSSKTTAVKILQRMKLCCFSCGWDKAACDIHHIVPASKGGTDENSNLTYLCPNCHRLAHRGKLTVFPTLEEKLGDSWKAFVPRKRNSAGTGRPRGPRKIRPPLDEGGNLKEFIKQRYRTAKARAEDGIRILKNSDIDFQSYGWMQQAAEVLQIQPQSVKKYLQKYDPHFLQNCFQRKSG